MLRRAGQSLILKLKQTETGLIFMEDLAHDLRNELESSGYLSGPSFQELVRAFGDSWKVFQIEGFIQDPNARKKMMLQRLDQTRAELGRLKEDVRKRDSLETDSEYRGASIPMGDAMDRIVHYERHVERQLYGAMDQLERLQRRRRGESVAPPLKLEIERT